MHNFPNSDLDETVGVSARDLKSVVAFNKS